MALDDIASALYGMPPDEFTAARDAQVKKAKSAGDPSLAAQIKAFRRPTAGAWAVNLLVRKCPKLVDGLLELGDTMRTAQAELDGNELRQLAKERQRLIATLRSEAKLLAEDAGTRLSNSALEELETTLEASVADTDAAALVRSGCVTTKLSYSGFGGLELSSTAVQPRKVRGGGPAASEAPKAIPTKGLTPELRAAEVAALEAEELASQARDRLTRSEKQLEHRHRDRVKGEERARELRQAEDEARGALKTARQEANTAERSLRTATRRLEAAKAKG